MLEWCQMSHTYAHTRTHAHRCTLYECSSFIDRAQKKSRNLRKSRIGSVEALSSHSEGFEQSQFLSQSLSMVPGPSQSNHRRNKSATAPLGWKNMSVSPSAHSSDSGVSVTSQESVCQTCGIPHDILVIPLQGRAEPVFEEFTVMSERQVGGALVGLFGGRGVGGALQWMWCG